MCVCVCVSYRMCSTTNIGICHGRRSHSQGGANPILAPIYREYRAFGISYSNDLIALLQRFEGRVKGPTLFETRPTQHKFSHRRTAWSTSCCPWHRRQSERITRDQDLGVAMETHYPSLGTRCAPQTTSSRTIATSQRAYIYIYARCRKMGGRSPNGPTRGALHPAYLHVGSERH